MNALLIGNPPPCSLGYTYVKEGAYDGVVIGSLGICELLHFSHGDALNALAAGKPVILYEPGLPEVKNNRALAAALSQRKRELKSWGVVFTSGTQRRVITAVQAQQMCARGERAAPGAVLTPLAKEILEGQL